MKDFNQAQALIKRLMEGVGGSADAYGQPEVQPPVTTPAMTATPARKMPTLPDLGTLLQPQPLLPTTRADEEGKFDEGYDICLEGMTDDRDTPVGGMPSISPEYVPAGVVESSVELKAVFNGFLRAIATGQPQPVKLESGTYQVLRPTSRLGWELHDIGKDYLYLQEIGGYSLAVIPHANEDDLFIWVMRASNHDLDLGYIHEGYVFLHK